MLIILLFLLLLNKLHSDYINYKAEIHKQNIWYLFKLIIFFRQDKISLLIVNNNIAHIPAECGLQVLQPILW